MPVLARARRDRVIRWQLVEKTKGLMEVISEADNAKHDSYRRESPLSVMLAIHKRACAKGEEVDYDKFVKCVSLLREVPAEFYGELAEVPCSQAPRYIIAVLKAAMTAPDRWVIGGKSRLMTAQDLASIASKSKEQVTKAAQIIETASALLDKAGIADRAASALALGTLEVRLVMFVHQKSAPGRRVFKTMTEVAVAFDDELSKDLELGSHMKSVKCPWFAMELAKDAKPSLQKMRGRRCGRSRCQPSTCNRWASMWGCW